MNRISALALAATATAASLILATAPAMAKSGPVTEVTKHGLYETVVKCPRWDGPAGGFEPLLAAPAVPKLTKGPKTSAGSHTGQAVRYDPLVTCTVTFLKDPPVGAPHKHGGAQSCAHQNGKGRKIKLMSVCCGPHRSGHSHMYACCPRLRQALPFWSSCAVLNTGFGGMARAVSRHEPGARR